MIKLKITCGYTINSHICDVLNLVELFELMMGVMQRDRKEERLSAIRYRYKSTYPRLKP